MRGFAIIAVSIGLVMGLGSCSRGQDMKSRSFDALSKEEERVIVHKGTEAPFSGKYNGFFEEGHYVCRRCEARLYISKDKFRSSCGWPSFDDEVKGAVRRQKDADGVRTEISCGKCGAHLGHVFEGEGLTEKNLRHCVNSVSLKFVPKEKKPEAAREPEAAKAYFAGGCFWGVEHLFEHKDGVLSAASGYMGGSLENPTYRQVCDGGTGHLETVEVKYDKAKVSYEELARFFFEIHDPTQSDGQGPDLGGQYHSAVFYGNEEERRTVEGLMGTLRGKGFAVVTKVLPAGAFWKAEEVHQDYYDRNRKRPYCHFFRKRF